MRKFSIIDEHDPALIHYLDELPLWSAPFALQILDKVIPAKNLRVLDIGFGTGVPLIELASRLGNSCKIYGIDPWKEACDRAGEKIRLFGINNITLFNAPAETLPLGDNSVDLIISNNGLNNVDDMEQVLKESFRVLVPSGKLIFTMNTEETMTEFYSIMQEVLSEYNLAASVTAMKNHIRQKRKPLPEVAGLLEKSGFIITSVDHDWFHYTFTDGTALFSHFFIRLAFLGPWLETVPKNYHQTIFSDIENRINTISSEKGHFRLTIPFVTMTSEKIR
ncbi:MAG: class I SAM-dependent methyltransferase [Bacteroidales bacterium]|nr:class I SAM-dependent methyltransferase [Bacteroidales bacterium]